MLNMWTQLRHGSIVLSIAAALAPIAKGQSVAVFPGPTVVGQTASTIAVSIAIASSGGLAGVSVRTQSVANGDFAFVAGGTCAQGMSYSSGQSCSVNVTFQPTVPGVRRGAVILLDGSGSLMGEANLIGTGSGGLAVLDPGNINTVAGDSEWLYRGDGVPAIQASLFLPMGVVADAAGNLYVSDTNNNRIRRVDASSGIISTVAGNGMAAYSGDGGPASRATVNAPAQLALDGAGNLYFADTANNVVRRIDAVTGTIATIAGTGGIQGYAGDNRQATSALLSFPEGVALDASGNLYIADTGNNVVRKVSVSGVITTVAGTGVAGFNGDGITATTAQLNSPWTATIGPDGSIYIADLNNNRVRKVDSSGVIHTVAGSGAAGFTGDGGTATAAQLKAPASVVADPAGDLYIADSGNNRVRKIHATTGIIETICGQDDESFGGDGAGANLASLYGPYALSMDQTGNLFIADLFHNRIREISALQLSLTYAPIRVGKLSVAQPVAVANAGNADLNLTGLPTVMAALYGAATTCDLSDPLIAGTDCTIGAVFAPTVTGNPVNGTITAVSKSQTIVPVIGLSGQVLDVNPTNVVLASSANPSVFAAGVTLTATITGGSAVTGTVLIQDGGSTLCTITLTSAVAFCPIATLAVGSHSLTATYSGDTENEQSTSTVLTQIVKFQPTVVLSATPQSAPVNSSIALTVAVAATTGTPTGTVTFYDGTTALGTVPLKSGVAATTVTSFSVGTHALTAQYNGDATNLAVTSIAVNEVVQPIVTTTQLTSSPSSSAFGSSVAFTAVVTGATPAPTGVVQFNDGGVSIGSAAVNASGTATLTISSLTPGTHSIVAVYRGDAADAASQSPAVLETVQPLASSTLLTSSNNPSQANAQVQLTASVKALTGSGVTATGAVVFRDGSTVLGTVTLDVNAAAVLTLNTLAVGSHSLTASFSGSNSLTASVSTALVQVVSPGASLTTLSSASSPAFAGQPVNLTASVSATTGTPTGTVSFFDGALRLGSAPLNAQGSASLSTSSLSVGNHSLTAVYSGDNSYLTSSSGVLPQTIVPATTTLALSGPTGPATFSQSVTFNASVTSPSANLTGSVTFTDGVAALAVIPLTANGVASYTTSNLSVGSHTILASYSGDANHATSNASLKELVVQPATMALSSGLNPSISGASVVFTATVTGPGQTAPTGTIVFSDGTTALGTVTLTAGGLATLQTSALSVGSHTITASYAGDANYSSGSSSIVQVVKSVSSQTTLTSSASPLTYGSAATFTATVSTNGGTATGTVHFTDNGTALGQGTLGANGTATLTTSTLVPGPHLVSATYDGSAGTSPSTATPISLSVLQTTTLALASSLNPTLTLSSIVLSASVSNGSGIPPSGSVTFMDGTAALATLAVDSTGTATYTANNLVAGTHALTARYAGDTKNFVSASPTLSELVSLRPTLTLLSSVGNDPANPQSVLLIGLVEAGGPILPTGTITFYAGTQSLGISAINSADVATWTVFVPKAGTTIAATYGGDANYAASSSQPSLIVGGPTTPFTLVLSPPSMTLGGGQHGNTNLTVISANGFTDNIQFGCLGLPFGATCTFSKTNLGLPGNGTLAVQLTIDTGNPLGSGSLAANQHGMSGTFACLFPAALLLGVAFRRRRNLCSVGLLLAIGVTFVTLGSVGCGGLKTNSTPAGTYNIKVTASGQNSGVTESQPMVLTVTQ